MRNPVIDEYDLVMIPSIENDGGLIFVTYQLQQDSFPDSQILSTYACSPEEKLAAATRGFVSTPAVLRWFYIARSSVLKAQDFVQEMER